MQAVFQDMIRELKAFFTPEKIYFNVDGPFIKFRMVVTEEKLVPMTVILDKFFKAPFKPAGERPARELAELEIIQALQGVRKEQTLYLNANDPEYAYFAAIWPWQSDPTQASLFSGLFFAGDDNASKKELMTKTKQELENIING